MEPDWDYGKLTLFRPIRANQEIPNYHCLQDLDHNRPTVREGRPGLVFFCVPVARIDLKMRTPKTRTALSETLSRPSCETRRQHDFHRRVWWALIPQCRRAEYALCGRIHLRNGGVQAILPSSRKISGAFLGETIHVSSMVAFEKPRPTLVAFESARAVWCVLDPIKSKHNRADQQARSTATHQTASVSTPLQRIGISLDPRAMSRRASITLFGPRPRTISTRGAPLRFLSMPGNVV